jgi:hypothetical protein
MAEQQKVLKIEKISDEKKTEEAALQPELVERKAPDKERFDELMGMGRGIEIKSPEGHKNSLMGEISEISGKVQLAANSSPDVLVSQTKDLIQKIEGVKIQLASPELQLKGSVQDLLKNKLAHIDESLKVVMNRAGLEYTPQDPTKANGVTTPIERFLGFLTHGQYQLQKLSSDVEMMHLNKTEITPASMLAIQIKVGYITQEIEFFSNMLNKMLESTKTIMNVQI